MDVLGCRWPHNTFSLTEEHENFQVQVRRIARELRIRQEKLVKFLLTDGWELQEKYTEEPWRKKNEVQQHWELAGLS